MIYFIQCGENGPVKIGQTSNGVEERLNQLQTGCPYKLKLLWVYHEDVYSEPEIHEIFKHERISGEWFHPSRNMMIFIHEELFNNCKIFDSNYGPIEIEEHFYHPNIGPTKIPQIKFFNSIQDVWVTFKHSGIYTNDRTKITYTPKDV